MEQLSDAKTVADLLEVTPLVPLIVSAIPTAIFVLSVMTVFLRRRKHIQRWH